MFRITSEISRQVFPVMLDLDSPHFLAGMERLRVISERIADTRTHGGLWPKLKRAGLAASAAVAFARLYFMRPKQNVLPREISLQPSW
ncbi:hypothetical protein, partial [Streptomyces sp. P17]|uniref:hypothetical protein n=1 Tax=Streptomyces sp. P17 TaxID=3074716 RepID=UPI0028F3EF9F